MCVSQMIHFRIKIRTTPASPARTGSMGTPEKPHIRDGKSLFYYILWFARARARLFKNFPSPSRSGGKPPCTGRYSGCQPRLEPSPILHTASRWFENASTLSQPRSLSGGVKVR